MMRNTLDHRISLTIFWQPAQTHTKINCRFCISSLMKTRLTHFGLFLLLCFGIGNVFSEPSELAHGERSGLYAFRIQGVPVERGMPGREQSQPNPQEVRRGRYVTLPDTSGYGALNENGMNSADNSRRTGRMSPEERRALRRQIDEAGHDLYPPKH